MSSLSGARWSMRPGSYWTSWRQPTRHGRAQQRQGGGVARRIVQRAGPRPAAIFARLHVGRAAGHHKPIKARQDRGNVLGRADRRQQHRNGTHARDHSFDILRTHDVLQATRPLLQACTDADDGRFLHGSNR